MSKNLDIVLLGATGYTGRLVAEYLADRLADEPSLVRWAIAGRDEGKLQNVRKSLTAINPQLSNLPILQCLTKDKASLASIAARTKVIINCIGPFSSNGGEDIVEACVNERSHYVDITGELSYVARLVQRFHQKAVTAGVCIVPCCGLDSMPWDLATLAVTHRPESGAYAGVAAIDLFAELSIIPSAGTVETALSEASQINLTMFWKMIEAWYGSFDGKRPAHSSRWPLLTKPWPHYNRLVRGWVFPMLPTIDGLVIRRSLELLHTRADSGFPQFAHLGIYLIVRSPWFPVLFLFGLLLTPLLLIVGKIPILKNAAIYLLRKNGREGPSLQERKETKIRIVAMSRDRSNNYRSVAHITASDPGYGSTAKWIAEAALLLVKGVADPMHPSSLIPTLKQGGVLTPASCFGHALIEVLNKRGVMNIELSH